MSELRDPRVLFAAERTLLAWHRSCLALMAFGFVIERFGLFVRLFEVSAGEGAASLSPPMAQVVGIGFVLLGAALALLSTWQYRQLLKSLQPAEIPPGYWVNLAVVANLLTAALGLGVAVYLWV